MFVTGIMRLFQSNCPRGVQNRISLEVAMLCKKSEARTLDTALERLLKTSLILGSVLAKQSTHSTAWQLENI